MSNNNLNDFFLFAINKHSLAAIEQIIYQHTDLENILGEDTYVELVSFNFEQADASPKLLDFFLAHLFSLEDLQQWLTNYYADTIEEIYQFILKVFFTVPALGDSTDLLEQDSNFSKKEGHNPHYRYSQELGEAEDIMLYYGYDANSQQINRITLIFESILNIYSDALHGNDGLLDQALQQNNTQLYTIIPHQVCMQFIDYCNSKLLAAPVQYSNGDGLFDQAHHQFRCYTWQAPSGATLRLMQYIDDRVWNRINAFVKVELVG
ncbi:MAG: hypothetical protein AB8E82_04560 [Aureispira sp.]